MVQLAGDEVDFGTDEDVVRVALCAVVAPGVVDAVEVLPSSEDKVQLVPMFRMSLGKASGDATDANSR